MGYYAAGGGYSAQDLSSHKDYTASMNAASAGGGADYDDDAPRRYRRTNVANVRALRRAMRRVQGFAKLARSTVAFTQRVKMKRARRRS